MKEVLLTLGDKGSLIYAKGQFHEIPAYSALQIVDATGCGDTYMVGYLYMRTKAHPIGKQAALPLPCVPSSCKHTDHSAEQRLKSEG